MIKLNTEMYATPTNDKKEALLLIEQLSSLSSFLAMFYGCVALAVAKERQLIILFGMHVKYR